MTPQRNRKKSLTYTVLLLLMIFLGITISFRTFATSSTSVTVSKNVYFHLAPYNTEINFAQQQELNRFYLDNDTWFWTFGNYKFQVQNANMTITKFFRDKTLIIHLKGSTGKISTTKIYVGNKGKPDNVIGADTWSYNSTTKIVTVTKLHTSPAEIIFGWLTTATWTIAPAWVIISIMIVVFASIMIIRIGLSL